VTQTLVATKPKNTVKHVLVEQRKPDRVLIRDNETGPDTLLAVGRQSSTTKTVKVTALVFVSVVLVVAAEHTTPHGAPYWAGGAIVFLGVVAATYILSRAPKTWTPSKLVWLKRWVGMVCLTSTWASRTVLGHHLNQHVTDTSFMYSPTKVGNLLLYAGYLPLALVAVLGIYRVRNHIRKTELLDTLIITGSLALLGWVVGAGNTFIVDTPVIWLQHQTLAVYCLGVVTVFVVTLRLVTATALRLFEWAVLGAMLAALIGDWFIQLSILAVARDQTPPLFPTGMFYVVALGLLMVAITHRSAQQPAHKKQKHNQQTITSRVTIAATAITLLLLSISLGKNSLLFQSVVVGITIVVVGAMTARYYYTITEFKKATAEIMAASISARNHVAQDLHDGPIQELLAVRLALEGTAAGEQLSTKINETMLALRTSMTALRDGIDGGDMLTQSLEVAINDMQRYGVIGFLENKASPNLSHKTASLIYRNTREALRNVTWHANASIVTVSILSSPHTTTTTVTDNGTGFNPTQAQSKAAEGHIGVASMRAAVLEAGGQFSLGPRPDSQPGTQLVFSIPN